MKKVLLVIFCLFIVSKIVAQPVVQWATTATNKSKYGGDQKGELIVRDKRGNILVGGSLNGVGDYDPSTAIVDLGPTRYLNFFIAKYDSAGHFIFAHSYGDLGTNQVTGIAVDDSDNIYLTGSFGGVVDFDPSAAVSPEMSSGNTSQMSFLTKYDSVGNFRYVKYLSTNITPGAIAIDSANHIFISGTFRATADFDPSPAIANMTSAGLSVDIFFARYDINGNYQYSKQIGGLSAEESPTMKLDLVGNLYLAGRFVTIVDFDPSASTFNILSSGGRDIFVAKYTNAGTLLFAKKMGGTNDDGATSLAIGSNGFFYLTGYFYGTADFDAGPSVSNLMSFSGNQDIFLVRYDTAGNYNFAKQIGGSANDNAFGIALDSANNVFMTGCFHGAADFDPSGASATLFSFTFSNDDDIFLAKYSASGNYLNAIGIGGSSSNDRGNGIVCAQNGQIYFTGYFYGVVDFNPSASINDLPGPGINVFLGHYDSNCTYLWANEMGGYNTIARYDYAFNVVKDNQGNVYVTGTFSDSTDFDPGPATFYLSPVVYADIFIAKYSSTGALIFAKQIGNSINDYAPYIELDNSGNIIIAGYFSGTTDFNPGPGINSLTSFSGIDVFIAKYSSSGNYLAATILISGAGDQSINGFRIDNADNIYTSSSSYGDYDPSAATNYGMGNGNMNVSKYNAAWNLVYSENIGGSFPANLYDMRIDLNGNLFITGRFSNIADFDPSAGTHNLDAINSVSMFLAEYGPNGNYLFAEVVGPNTSTTGIKLLLDVNDNLYVLGNLYGTVDLDPSASTAQFTSTLNNSGGDMFLAKYTSTGQYLFAKQMINVPGLNAVGMSWGKDSMIYIAGALGFNADFDSSSVAGNLSALNGNSYLVFFDQSGNYINGETILSQGQTWVESIHAYPSGEILISGTYDVTCEFDSAAQHTLTCSNFSDMFVTQYLTCVPATPVFIQFSQDTVCYNAGSITLIASPSGGVWSGSGITGNSFDPIAAGIGQHSVFYTFTDSLACSSTVVDTLSVDICLSASSCILLQQFNVLPNPVTDQLYITSDKISGNAIFVLRNFLGQEILFWNETSIGVGYSKTIDVEKLDAGVYFLEMISDNNKTVKKFVKN